MTNYAPIQAGATSAQSGGASGSLSAVATPPPLWQTLGYSSLEEWVAAGQPTTPKQPDPVQSFTSGASAQVVPEDQRMPIEPPIDYTEGTGAAGTLRGQLLQQRQGGTEYGAITDAIAESPLGEGYRAVDDTMQSWWDTFRAANSNQVGIGRGASKAAEVVLPQNAWELPLELTGLGLAGDIADARRIGSGLIPDLSQSTAEALVRGTPVDDGTRLLSGPGAGREIPAPRPGISGAAASDLTPEQRKALEDWANSVNAETFGGPNKLDDLLEGMDETPGAIENNIRAALGNQPGNSIPPRSSLPTEGMPPTPPPPADSSFTQDMFSGEVVSRPVSMEPTGINRPGFEGTVPEQALPPASPSMLDESFQPSFGQAGPISGDIPSGYVPYRRLGDINEFVPPSANPDAAQLGFFEQPVNANLYDASPTSGPLSGSPQFARTGNIGEFTPPSPNPDAPNLTMREQPVQSTIFDAQQVSGPLLSGQPLTPDAKAAAQRIKADMLKRADQMGEDTPLSSNIFGNAVNEFLGAVGLAQSQMASLDTPILRQMMYLGLSNPAEYRAAAVETLKAWASDDAAYLARAAIESSPWFSPSSVNARAGYGFTDLGGHLYDWGRGVQNAERVPGFTGINNSRIARASQHLPWIKAGERAYATGLNVEAMRVYEKMAENMWQAGIRDKSRYQALVNVINHARGYGSVNPGQILPGFNAFFSGRNLVANVEKFIDPIRYANKPEARNLAVKNLGAFMANQVAFMGFLGLMGSYAGGLWSVDMDPRSSDWGKLRVGNTSIDTTGGLGPMVRLMVNGASFGTDLAGLTEGASKFANVDDFINRGLIQFFRNKEAPWPSKITEWLTSTDFLGRQISRSEIFTPARLAEMYMPFLSTELFEAWNANQNVPLVGPVIPTAFSAIGGFFGAGGQSYRRVGEEIDRKLTQEMPSLRAIDGSPITTFDQFSQNYPAAADNWKNQNKPLFDEKVESSGTRSQQDNEIISEWKDTQEALDSKYLLSNPQEWRTQSGDLSNDIGAARAAVWDGLPDRDVKGRPADAMNQEYHKKREEFTDPETKELDHYKMDQWISSLSMDAQRLLFEVGLKHETEPRKEFLTTRWNTLMPYWKTQEEVWGTFTKNNPEWAAYNTLDDFLDAEITKMVYGGGDPATTPPRMGWTDARANVEKLYSFMTDAVTNASYAYIAENYEELLPALNSYDYYVPAAWRPILQGMLSNQTP